MIRITRDIALGEEEVRFKFVRASGPGGQNVNKVSSAAQLRFDVAGSPSLDDDVKARLTRLAGARMTTRGVLVIEAGRHRTQKANRADALGRLVGLIRRAARRPKQRRPTRPTPASMARRLDAKRLRSRAKRLRGHIEQQ